MLSFTRGIDGLGDVTVDGSIDVNNSPDPEGGGTSGGDEAVVALSIVLALVLLAIIAGLVYYKRR